MKRVQPLLVVRCLSRTTEVFVATGSAASGPSVSDADVQAALTKGGTLNIWAWEPTLKQATAAFEKQYPNVHVNLVNAGTGDKQYTALQNAVAAGKGVPDIAQIEYYALPQFAIGKALDNLSGFGAAGLKADFTPGPWNSVQNGGGIYGLPMDSGPMALYYNKTIFDKYKLPVPTTWDQYLDDSRRIVLVSEQSGFRHLHVLDPLYEQLDLKRYLANTHLQFSLILRAAGRLDEALAHLRTGFTLAQELGSQIIRLHQRYHRTAELETKWKKFAEANPRDLGGYLQLIDLY